MKQTQKWYRKLARDRIPEIIEKNGKIACTRVLSEHEFLESLHKKLQEEVSEYLEDNIIEELADVLEVIHAIALFHQVTLSELETVRKKKAVERGGFARRIFLEYVQEKEE